MVPLLPHFFASSLQTSSAKPGRLLLTSSLILVEFIESLTLICDLSNWLKEAGVSKDQG